METVFIITLGLLFLGGFGSLILRHDTYLSHMTSSITSIAASVCALIFSVDILLSRVHLTAAIPTMFPFFVVSFRIDALAAFFIGIVALIALPASFYGIGYLKHYYSTYSVGTFGFFYNLFLLSLFLVVSASNGFYFLFVWELMSLTSLFLVLFEHEEPQTIHAGLVYFVMTHIATGCILLAFFLLYQYSGSFDFLVIQAHAAQIPTMIKSFVYLLLIVGFGTKAGIVPFHIWLPKAHSAAPSHVSALMSGVMIKMGIFMFFRMFLDVLPQPSLWLGVVILLIGASSSILGVLYALSEHDSKRLLAYHSIENIGIILLGLGSGLIFLALHLPALASLAIVAGLFHTLNHAIFKSLLFFGAGSVIAQTHTRNIEEYGGLIKRMPATALFFLIGAIAISGLPPFNGFASEWLTFQSLFAGIALQSMIMKSIFITAGVALAFTGGLAAACFVKAFGAMFLARPRSKESEKAHESSIFFTSGMALLALLCVLLGVFAATVGTYLQMIVQNLAAMTKHESLMTTSSTAIHIAQNNATLAIPMLTVALVIAIAITISVISFISRQQKIVRRSIWNCGYTEITPAMEITATGFSRSLILIFKGLFKPTKQHTIEYVDANMRYFSTSRTVTLAIVNLYEEHIYYPLHHAMITLSKQFKRIQGGNINQYLLYIFVVLVGLLIWARY